MNRLNSNPPNAIFSLSYLNKWQEQMAFKICCHYKSMEILFAGFLLMLKRNPHIPADCLKSFPWESWCRGSTALWLVPLQSGRLFSFQQWSFPFCKHDKLSKLSSETRLIFFCSGRKGSSNTDSTPLRPGLATVWVHGLPWPCANALSDIFLWSRGSSNERRSLWPAWVWGGARNWDSKSGTLTS